MKLLFDFGGVLVDLDRERVVNAFAELGLDMHNYLGAYRQSGPFSLLEQGKISVHEFCNEIRNLTGHTELTDESIVKAWKAFLPGVPAERLENAAEKSKQHYSVNLLSNTNVIHWQQACDDFFHYHDREVNDFSTRFSCRTNWASKNQNRAFTKPLSRLGCAGKRDLFLTTAR